MSLAAVFPGVASAERSIRFAVKGDWGYGSTAQADVSSRMCARNASIPYRFVLTTGDNFYRPDGAATTGNFDDPERCLIQARIPWRAAWGNHDLAGSGTATRLGGTSRWYRFRSGPATIVVLDANQPNAASQRSFLARVLAAAPPGPLIVALHQPLYTGGPHAPNVDAQRQWAPLFRQFHVDLVLQGHNHLYERLRVDGVRYITTGGGGAPVYPCIRAQRGLERCVPVNHFLEVRASETAIAVTAVQADGHVIERIVESVHDHGSG